MRMTNAPANTSTVASNPIAHCDSVGTTEEAVDKASKKPRISPPGKFVVWMFKYAWPATNPAASTASALAGVPPFAVMKAGFHVDAANVLNV